MRRFAILTPALGLLLSGCWTGDSFYSRSESVAAIPAGQYKVVRLHGPIEGSDNDILGQRLRVSYDKDGRAHVENMGQNDESESILIKLGNQPGLYVAQAEFGPERTKYGSAAYALVNLTPDGYQIAVPRCDQKRAALWDRAVVSGLLVGKPVCKFSNRAALEAALQDYAKDPISWTEYRRVGKRKTG